MTDSYRYGQSHNVILTRTHNRTLGSKRPRKGGVRPATVGCRWAPAHGECPSFGGCPVCVHPCRRRKKSEVKKMIKTKSVIGRETTSRRWWGKLRREALPRLPRHVGRWDRARKESAPLAPPHLRWPRTHACFPPSQGRGAPSFEINPSQQHTRAFYITFSHVTSLFGFFIYLLLPRVFKSFAPFSRAPLV